VDFEVRLTLRDELCLDAFWAGLDLDRSFSRLLSRAEAEAASVVATRCSASHSFVACASIRRPISANEGLLRIGNGQALGEPNVGSAPWTIASPG
jgi:hypothetical protein